MKKRVYFLVIFSAGPSSDRLFGEKRRFHPVSGVLYQHLRHEAGGRELHAGEFHLAERGDGGASGKNGPSPGGSDHVKALPDEVKVEHCVLKAREVDVDFNEAYNDMDPVREILVRAAFVNTLIQVSNVEQVVITVNGEDLVDEAGDVVGGMTAESFIDTKGDGINSYQNGTLSLYFADSDGSLIEREMRNVHYSSNSTLEKVILEELIKGPVNAKLQAVLPAETKVLSVQTEGGTCTVNFDSAFNAAPSSESNVTAETSLYAAVDALIDTAGVREVIIQIEGSQETPYRDEIDLTQPFTKREDLIHQVVSSESDVLEPSVGVDSLWKSFF